MSLPRIVQAVNARVSLAGDESISDVKTYTDSPVVPDVTESDFSQKTANTKFVKTAVRHAVDELQKQINALEGTVLTATEDSTTAYTKAVPVSADLFKYAAIRNFGGRSIVWNQLCSNQRESQTSHGLDFTNNGDGSWTVSGTLDSAFGMPINLNYEVTGLSGHKFILLGCPSGGSDSTYCLSVGSYKDFGNGVIFQLGADTLLRVWINVFSGTTINLTFKPRLCDLTRMFGAGNEPSTVEEFRAIFPDEYYAYSAGEIKSAAVTNIRSNIYSWNAIKKAVNEENLLDYLQVGDLLDESWTDVATSTTYSGYQLRLDDFKNLELANGTTKKCAILESKWVHPFGVQFSHQRAFLACPEGLAAGTYYFTIESNWGSNVSAGDVVCFTTTVAVPAGGRVSGCYGAPDQAKSTWRIYSHSADGKTVLETITPTINPESPSGTSLGTIKLNTRNGDLNSCQEMAYGCNRWKTSALRQYLNSAAGVGEWWTAQDDWDIAPTELTTKAGYLSGFDEDFLSVLREVRVVTYGNTVTEGGVEDVTYDRIWLPSLGEMYINPQVNGEGDPLEYWKLVNGTDTKWAQNGTYPELKHYALENHASAQSARLRSAGRGFASYAWSVNSSGFVYSNYGASYSYRFAPLFAI